MSLFGDLFGSLFVSLETSIAEEFAVYQNKIDRMIARENALLTSLGIKPPRIVSGLNYNIEPRVNYEKKKYLHVELIPPKFEFPAHRVFVIDEYKELVVTLFKDIKRVDRSYKWWGLSGAIKPIYGAIWTSRDPFALYRLLTKKTDGVIICYKPGDFTSTLEAERSSYSSVANNHDEAIRLPPLRGVKGISREEAAKIHLRIRLYNYVTDNCHDLQYENFYNIREKGFGAGFISTDIRFKLPVPCTMITADYTCLRSCLKTQNKG